MSKAFRDIKKLGDDNIYVWKEEVRCGMIIERLSKWLAKEPASDNATEMEESARCYAYIYMTLEPRWQRELTARLAAGESMTAMAVWNYLLDAAVSDLRLHELAYTTQLNNLKQGSTQSIAEYLEECGKAFSTPSDDQPAC